jgi:SET domain-containing protein
MTIYTEADFEIRPSTIKGAGTGLFSRVNIELEETIGYYTGEVITETQLYEEGKFAGSDYIMWVCKNHIIVGEGPRANYTRYINHSSEPNAFLIVSTRWKSARFECVNPIRPGDEIFFNYGELFPIG